MDTTTSVRNNVNLNNQGINLTLQSAGDITTLCQPLYGVGLSYFSYTKIYPNGSRIDLNNHAEMSQKYYVENDLYSSSALEGEPAMEDTTIDRRLVFWSTLGNDPSIAMARETFNIANGITLVENNSGYVEMWHFATSRSNHNIVNLYINHPEILYKFTHYFRDRAKPLIKEAQKTVKVITPLKPYNTLELEEKCYPIKQANLDNYFSALDINKYYLGPHYGDEHLTKRQSLIIYYMSIGKSSEEIGMILGNAPNTIRHHIETIKQKLGCSKNMQIIAICKSKNII